MIDAGDELVFALDGARSSIADVGGKAAGLAALIRGRFPVPPAFVVSVAAQRAFVADNGLGERIADAQARVDPLHPDTARVAARSIRACFEESPLSVPLRERLAHAARALTGDTFPGASATRLAVRSSALAEDLAGTSAAGQQDTLLAIEPGAPLETALRRCWASLFSARAILYRRRSGIACDGMGVVVQRMIDPRAAGTLSTWDPVAGDRARLVVTSTFGLGSPITAGLVTPDVWTVAADGRIARFQIGEKRLREEPCAEGTRIVPLAVELQRAPSLSAGEVEALAALGRRVEAAFGVPQEIEWAIGGERIHLLQARPLTGIAVTSPTAQ